VVNVITRERLVGYLERLWPENKAKGLLAQLRFKAELQRGLLSQQRGKFFDGCWLLAPKREDFFKFRFCFFVHGSTTVGDLPHELDPRRIMEDDWRFHRVAAFLKKAGLGVFYAVPTAEGGELRPDAIRWSVYKYSEERLRSIDAAQFFGRWPGRGRSSHGTGWSGELRSEFLELREEELVPFWLNEIFYSEFIKGLLKKPASDPYDVDGFILSYSGAVLPMEVKEKFPAASPTGTFFGIDAGRLLMLLRLCLPNDSNAIYLIREVSEKGRKFVGWRFMTLSEIVASASWNLQRGGTGMGGQETQTVRLPYSSFHSFGPDFMSEENLERVANLPKDIKRIADEFGRALEMEFFGAAK
jgi:hypothetical protein